MTSLTSIPDISVVMPVYNAERYVAEAIESILNQTFNNFEFIIIDDGSTDNSLKILKDYAHRDKRIRLVSRENKGLIKTLNEGVALAITPLIARMDADDISYSERFAKQIAFFKSHPDCGVVGSKVRFIDDNGDPIISFPVKTNHQDIDGDHLLGYGGAITHPVAMFKKALFHSVKGYDEQFPHAEDLELWLRMAEVSQLANLPDILLDYRQHVQSVGYKFEIEQINSTRKAIENASHRRGVALQAEINEVIKKKSENADIFLKWAWWAFSAENLKTSKKYAIKAFKERPFSIEVLKLHFHIVFHGFKRFF